MASPAVLASRTDTRLLACLQAGDEATWRTFDTRWRPALFGFARRLGLDAHAAADVAQDTLAGFVLEWRRGRYEQGRGRLRSWLYSMARARVSKLLRKRGNELGWRGASALGDLPSEGELERAFEREWERARLRAALEDLRRSQLARRTLRAFELHCLEGRSPGEVAAELGMSVESIYVAKHRVLARLRERVLEVEA